MFGGKLRVENLNWRSRRIDELGQFLPGCFV
jgi:hypothetical protein